VVSLATDSGGCTIRLAYAHDGPIEAEVDGLRLAIEPLADDGCEAALRVDGLRVPVMLVDRPDGGWFDAFGVSAGFDDRTDAPPATAGADAGGDVASRMHGAVTRVAVTVGDRVERGDLLVAVEAMKMEHRFEAAVAGTVLEVMVAAGQQVAPGRLMVRIVPGAAS
jgi:geranyl-CoA carboxylase alpha subunit